MQIKITGSTDITPPILDKLLDVKKQLEDVGVFNVQITGDGYIFGTEINEQSK